MRMTPVENKIIPGKMMLNMQTMRSQIITVSDSTNVRIDLTESIQPTIT